WSAAGVASLRRGELEEARRALEVALEIHPPNLAALLNLALVHRRAGRPRRAARAYAAASEQLGREEASRLRLERRLPKRYRSRPPLPAGETPGLVVSIVPALSGDAGRMLVDGVLALRGRPQLVVCGEAAVHEAEGL